MKSPLSQAGTLGVCATSLLALPAAHADMAASESAATDASSDKLEQVVVKGVRPLIDDKLAGSTQNVPQSVTVVSSELMSAQAKHSPGGCSQECAGHYAECRRRFGAPATP